MSDAISILQTRNRSRRLNNSVRWIVRILNVRSYYINPKYIGSKSSAISISWQKPNITMAVRQANYNVIFFSASWHWHTTAPNLFIPWGENSYWESECRSLIILGIIMNSLIKSGLDNMCRKLKRNKMLYLEVTVQTQCNEGANDPSSFSWGVFHWRNSIHSEICWVVAREGSRWPFEHFCSQKAVTTKCVALHWEDSIRAQWRATHLVITCIEGRVKFRNSLTS